MKKERKFKNRKFESGTLFSAYKQFIKISPNPEIKLHIFRIEEGDMKTELDDSEEFFAKVPKSDASYLCLHHGNDDLTIWNHESGSATVSIELKDESEIQKILDIFDGKKIISTVPEVQNSNDVKNLEKKIDTHMAKNTKYTIIGGSLTVVGIIMALFLYLF